MAEDPLENNLGEDNWLFRANYTNDPFREEHEVFDHLQTPPLNGNGFFQLKSAPKIGQSKNAENPAPVQSIFKSSPPPLNDSPEKNNSLFGVIKDFSHQIFASIIILIIGFLLLNFSAYYQITQSKINDFLGNEPQISVMEEAAGLKQNPPPFKTDSGGPTTNPLKRSEITVNNVVIPALNMEIAPSDNRIIIPRISQNIPIASISSENLLKRDWNALEKDMQEALKNGVVHYPGTSLPNQNGNVVITGHSSYFPWDPGRFKDVFALLHQLVEGDKIVVYYEQKKYIYQVTNIKVVMPDNVDVLKQTPTDQLTLITCTPVGTNLKRLIVTAQPIEE